MYNYKKTYFGYSNNKVFNPSVLDDIHPDLKKLIDKTESLAMKETGTPSFETWTVDNCAEVQAVNQALYDGVKIEDIFIRTVRFSDGAYAAPCKNCAKTFADFIIATE